MFEVSVAASFQATHAVTVAGVDETPHEHDWEVVVHVQGEQLDDDALLLDFLALQQSLEDAVAPLRGANLNTCDEMNGQNPSAEQVARYIAMQVQDKIHPPVTLSSVQITEAPNCTATYRP